jgi:hypothetical protein
LICKCRLGGLKDPPLAQLVCDLSSFLCDQHILNNNVNSGLVSDI